MPIPMWTNKQKEYGLNANHRWNVKIGAVRSGKTYQDKEDIIPRRIRERIGKNGLVVLIGVTKSTIERNVLRPMRDKFGSDLVGNINNENKVKLFGEECYCLGAEKVNQVSKIQGSSIKYLYGDEVVKWSKEVFDMLKSRLDQEYSIADLTGNPEQSTHWFKEFLESNADIYIQHYTLFDNSFLPPIFVENLCKEYEGTVYYNRYVLGQWCNAEGIIFKQIADNKDRFITDNKLNGYISIGIDWGGNGSKHSICATSITRDYSKLQVLKSDVMVATGTDTQKIFKWIIDFIQEIRTTYGKVDIIWCDSAEQVLNNSLRSELNKNGLSIPIKDSMKTPISERIKTYNILLNTNRISFLKDNTNTIIEALQTALYDEKAQDDRWIDDGQTSDIDSLDSFNYSFEYWFKQLMLGG